MLRLPDLSVMEGGNRKRYENGTDWSERRTGELVVRRGACHAERSRPSGRSTACPVGRIRRPDSEREDAARSQPDAVIRFPGGAGTTRLCVSEGDRRARDRGGHMSDDSVKGRARQARVVPHGRPGTCSAVAPGKASRVRA